MTEVHEEIVILLEARIFFFFLTVYMGDKNSDFARVHQTGIMV